jgi:hypothetical protein
VADFKTLDDVKAFLDEQGRKLFGTPIEFDPEKGKLPSSQKQPHSPLIPPNLYREHILDTSGGVGWQFVHATKSPAQIFFWSADDFSQKSMAIHMVWVDRQTQKIVEAPEWYKKAARRGDFLAKQPQT